MMPDFFNIFTVFSFLFYKYGYHFLTFLKVLSPKGKYKVNSAHCRIKSTGSHQGHSLFIAERKGLIMIHIYIVECVLWGGFKRELSH